MKFTFFKTGDQAWKEVQEKILKSIEEEESRNQPVVVTSAGERIYIEETQPKIHIHETEKTSTAADSGLIIDGGIQ